MLNEQWKQFKSGTDIRGVASEGVEGQSVNLTEPAVRAMCAGFILWLSKKCDKSPHDLVISVGRDSRISGPAILGYCADVMKSVGVRVLDCGLASTPSMFMTTAENLSSTRI